MNAVIQELLDRKGNLEIELRKVDLEIKNIRSLCEHKNNKYSESSPDPHSGKRDDHATCIDCGYARWI